MSQKLSNDSPFACFCHYILNLSSTIKQKVKNIAINFFYFISRIFTTKPKPIESKNVKIIEKINNQEEFSFYKNDGSIDKINTKKNTKV